MKTTILLVEDSRFLRVANERALLRAGYSAISAADGEAALLMARERMPGLILLDLKLPKVTGLEVLQKIRADPRTRRIPVVILTTSRNPLDHSQCKTLGADMCLSKPHNLKEYENMVQRLISWASLRVNDNTPAVGSA